MSKLNSDLGWEGVPLPCQVFDVICGSSAGGLIAVLIGRLGLDCSTAMSVFNELFSALFGGVDKWETDGIVDCERNFPDAFEEKLVSVVEKYTGDKDTPMRVRKTHPGKVDHSSTDTFVTVVQSGFSSTGVEPYRLRSYATPRGGTDCIPGHDWTIREVIRTVTALSGYFKPVEIGSWSFKDASCSGCANPVWDAISEFALRWPKNLEPIVISLGAGLQPLVDRRRRENDTFGNQLLAVARDTELAHLHAHEHFRIRNSPDNYFRFNPPRGPGDTRDFIGDPLPIITAAEAWLRTPSGHFETMSACRVLKERFTQDDARSNSDSKTHGVPKTSTRDQSQQGSPEQSNIHQLGSTNILSQYAIEEVIRKTLSHGPNVLIDVKTGRLYNRAMLVGLLKEDQAFQELVASMADDRGEERIQGTVKKYLGYVMLSHVWGNGKEEEKENEPSFKAANDSGSVYRLPANAMTGKLRNFCGEVDKLGCRWAWSDTCCINKSDDAVLSQSLRSMYRWYEGSDATLVYLGDVSSDPDSLSDVDLLRSLWMTRAWTLQEGLAPKRVLFYSRDWRPYRGIISRNHKEPGVVLEELANATGIPSQTLVTFHPGCLGVREKLHLASTRKATCEEDIAYSLMGIFTSDIIPRYGEGVGDALGHLLEWIIAHSGDVTILEWTGSPSSYNSCLPSSLAVYSQLQPTINALAGDMESHTSQLSTTLSKDDVLDVYRRVERLAAARFDKRRLQLPCIVFRVKSLLVYDWDDHGNHLYQAKVSGIGLVKLKTRDKLPLVQPQKLVVVHPWMSDVRGPDDVVETDASDSDRELEEDSDAGTDEEGSSASGGTAWANKHALALRMMVRLLQPFTALLLQQSGNDYKRVAADDRIVVKISESYVRSKGRDSIRTEVLDVL